MLDIVVTLLRKFVDPIFAETIYDLYGPAVAVSGAVVGIITIQTFWDKNEDAAERKQGKPKSTAEKWVIFILAVGCFSYAEYCKAHYQRVPELNFYRVTSAEAADKLGETYKIEYYEAADETESTETEEAGTTDQEEVVCGMSLTPGTFVYHDRKEKTKICIYTTKRKPKKFFNSKAEELLFESDTEESAYTTNAIQIAAFPWTFVSDTKYLDGSTRRQNYFLTDRSGQEVLVSLFDAEKQELLQIRYGALSKPILFENLHKGSYYYTVETEDGGYEPYVSEYKIEVTEDQEDGTCAKWVALKKSGTELSEPFRVQVWTTNDEPLRNAVVNLYIERPEESEEVKYRYLAFTDENGFLFCGEKAEMDEAQLRTDEFRLWNDKKMRIAYADEYGDDSVPVVVENGIGLVYLKKR